MSKKVLLVEARFYEDMADALAEGAIAALDAAGVAYERVSVPGVLEVPVAIKYAAETNKYDAYVALGVVIRGETTHYEIVCGESARGLMGLVLKTSCRLAMVSRLLRIANRLGRAAKCLTKTRVAARQKQLWR